MAMAAETVIIEAEEVVEIGEIDPNCVATPFKFINFIVGGAE
jgi:acetate CoA/acetoacetate CoA-transferase alpha subunit